MSLRFGASLSMVLASALVGCGKDPVETDPPGDTDVEVETPPETPVADIAPPEIPWLADGAPPVALPRFACPEGWSAVEYEAGFQTCDPWAGARHDICDADHEAQLPGSASCAPIGAACPTGDWADGLPATGVWYVKAGAAEGSGTADLPYGTVAEALAVAAEGDIVALAAGTYDESLAPSASVTLWGACAAQTVLTSSTCAEEGAAVAISAGSVTLRDLSIADAACAGVSVSGGAALLEGVSITGATGAAMRVTGGAVEADGLVLRGTRSASDLTGGDGLRAEGGEVTLRRAAIEKNRSFGLYAGGGTPALTLEDVVVDSTLHEEATDALGVGINTTSIAAVRLHRVVAENNRSAGIRVSSAAEADLQDVVVARTKTDATADTSGGTGLSLFTTGEATCARIWLADNASTGMIVSGVADYPEAAVTCEDVVVDTTLGEGSANQVNAGVTTGFDGSVTIDRLAIVDSASDGVLSFTPGLLLRDLYVSGADLSRTLYGYGVAIAAGEATIERAILAEGARGGLYVGAESIVSATDVLARDNPGKVVDISSFGVVTTDTAYLTLDRARITGTAGSGLIAYGGKIVARDLVVEDGTIAVTGTCLGVGAGGAGQVELERARLERNAGTSVWVFESGIADLTDVEIVDTQPGNSGTEGLGVFAGGTSGVRGDNVSISGSTEAGIYATSSSTVRFNHLWVRDTTPMACVATTCPDYSGTWGVYAGGAAMQLTDFVIEDNGSVGVGAATGTVGLTRGYILGHALGLDEKVVPEASEVVFYGNEADRGTQSAVPYYYAD